jgi:site-specific DNA recombinase
MKSFKAEKNTGNRVVGYIRVSDDSQVDGYSLDAQRVEITRWCNRHGHELVDVYADEGVSAHTDKVNRRPQMTRLLEDAKCRIFDIAVVHTLDRWARNGGVQRQTLQQLGEYDVGFASVMEDFDFTTPSGRLLLTTMGGVAEFFSDQLGMHVDKAQRRRAESGLPVGPVPFVYYGTLESSKIPRLNEREAQAMKEAFQRRAEGQSYGGIAAWLNEQGFRTRKGHPFTAHAVKDILNNHFYCGYVKYKGKEYLGKHEAIISEDLFQRVQARKQHRQQVRLVHGPKGLLQGMIACSHCGNGLQSDRHRQQVPLYRERHAHECPSNNTSIIADPIDRQVATIVHSLELQPDWKQKMAELAVVNHDGPNPEELRGKRRRIVRAYGDGGYTDQEYRIRLAEIDRQIEQTSAVTPPAIEDAMKLFEDIPILWNEATAEERRMLVKSLVELVYVDIQTKRVTAVKPTPAFRALFGVGIEVGSDAPIDLQAPEWKIKDIVGDGGGGGGLNSPSRRRLPESATGLVSSFISPG